MAGGPAGISFPRPLHSAMDLMRNDYQNSAAAQIQAYHHQMSALQQQQLPAMLNPYTNVYPISPPPTPERRTPEQIDAMLSYRYADLQKQAVERDAKLARACGRCRWGDGLCCTNALVRGFKERADNWEWADKWRTVPASGHPELCGPEKALWQAKRNMLQRLIDWFIAPWVEERAARD